MDDADDQKYLMEKKTLSPGTKYVPFVDGTRVNNLLASFFLSESIN